MMFLSIYIGLVAAFICRRIDCLSRNEIAEILDWHNAFRRQFAISGIDTEIANMNSLIWSQHLQNQADNEVSCQMTRTEEDPFSRLQINYGVFTGDNFTSVFDYWTVDQQYFIPAYRTCMDFDRCKHFLTIINANLQYIGCSIQRHCRRGPIQYNVLMCIYESGNEWLQLYKTGKVCTKCDDPNPFCDKGLCTSCDDTAGQSCDCRKTCNKAHIGEGTRNNQTCSCDCRFGMGPNCDEDCVNPPMYVGWDICETISKEECQLDAGLLLRDFCPATCSCVRHPDAAGKRGVSGLEQNN